MTNPDIPIIFIHGAGSNADFWHEQHVAFPNAHYINLPGHQSLLPGPKGRNPQSAIRNPQSIGDYANWVGEYIHERALSDVVLNGHSMGGAIGLTLALGHPDWLKGLVLTGTGARLRVSPRLLELLRTDYPAAVEMILRLALPPLQEPLTYKQRIRRDGIRRHILRTPQAVTLNDYEACNRFDVMERVKEIAVSTLCVVGTLDRMTPPKYSEYLHSQISGSQLVIIEGAGHMLPLEKPEEYNSAVIQSGLTHRR